MRDSNLNVLSVEELRREIGSPGKQQLLELGYWLQLKDDEIPGWQERFRPQVMQKQLDLGRFYGMPPRLAPSLTCRSEIELFGRSTPRFAIRLGLSEPGGFLNLRRLGTLAGQLCFDELVPGEVVDSVLKAPCVADAFLKPPSRLGDRWQILTAPLAKACCELEHGSSDQDLTPYARHMKPGGGMCAQAACFMAAGLHRRLDAPLHGVPEVTYMATEKKGVPQDKITFDGLSTEEIEAYFNHRRNRSLHAAWEASKIQYGNTSPDVLSDPSTGLVQDFSQALRSYVLSNMPVIVPVDVGRMQGVCSGGKIKYVQARMDGNTVEAKLNEPIFGANARSSLFNRNGLESTANSGKPIQNLAHVVLVVGCTKPERYEDSFDLADQRTPLGHENTFFAFNDPAHFPFMCATAHELLLAACYAESGFDTLLLGWLLPITPHGVKMPLLDETTGSRAGIKAVSEMLKQITFRCGNGILVKRRLMVEGHKPEFRLVRAVREEIIEHLKELLQYETEEGIEEKYSELLNRFSKSETAGWCWLEVDGQNVFIWDAQNSVLKKTVFVLDSLQARAQADQFAGESVQRAAANLAGRLLLGLTVQQEQGLKTYSQYVTPAPPAKKGPAEVLTGSLEPALLTSFEVVRKWSEVSVGDNKEAVEFYMLMQGLGDKLLVRRSARLKRKFRGCWNKLRGERRANSKILPVVWPCALDLMANASDNERRIKRVASELLASGRKIISIATYLPSLCAGEIGPNPRLGANPALLALQFVLRVVANMKSRVPLRSPQVVELVGGSRMVARIDSSGPNQHFIRCVGEARALDNIFACLELVLQDVEAAGVKLAFEFEPSSLVALGSLEAIEKFCEELDRRSELDQRWNLIGLNLDIPHYAFIGGHRPGDLPPFVAERIFHSHISFHTRGHLADGILEDDDGTDFKKLACLEWLLLLEGLKVESSFGGFVSLEIESAKTREQVHNSLEILKSWLNV